MAKSYDEMITFEGVRPSRVGDVALESQGMAPIPTDSRYGGTHRMFTVWFAPNMEMSVVFAGALAAGLGLGFGLGILAIFLGSIVGSVLVAVLCTWGPSTGTGQLPLARIPFGRAVVLPGAMQWLSTIGWDVLVGLFGGQAAHLLLGVPFWVGVLIVLGLGGAVSVLGYEFVHRLQSWGSTLLTIMFTVLAIRIFQNDVVLPRNSVQGGELAGAFVLVVSIFVSLGVSWAPYASDYSRYLPPASSKVRVFVFTLAGLTCSYVFAGGIGLAAASVLGDQTATGVRTLMGGGPLGALALFAIMFGAITANSMNDYSGSLAFQATGARVKRPITAAIVAAIAFIAILWLNTGSVADKFQAILFFINYWIAPFSAIVVVDWYYAKGRYVPEFLRTALVFRNLSAGWSAFVALVLGFAAMVPFMNTSIVVGPVARAMYGADLAIYVGFVVSGVAYLVLRQFVPRARPVAIVVRGRADRSAS
jgi:NCS1 family nucleobase:cation symporter-1